MIDLNKIDACFPLEKYREGQKECISSIATAFNSGLKYVLLEAPTGSGKSAIGMTIAQMVDSAYYLAPQKFLQDQLVGDFGETGKHATTCITPMIDLKGRNTYPCNYWERQLESPDPSNRFIEHPDLRKKYQELVAKHPGCDEGQCRKEGVSKLPYCVDMCPYYNRLHQAIISNVTLMNFHNFLWLSQIPNLFPKRELLILDEGHNTEDILMGFVELSLSDRHFSSTNIKFPKLETVKEYMKYLEDIQLDALILSKIHDSIANGNVKEEDEWKNVQFKYEIFKKQNPDNWVCIWEETKNKSSRSVVLKPIFVDSFAQDLIFSKVNKVLIMSATIFKKSIICTSLGINPEQAASFRMPSTFPAKNRPIYFQPSGAMSYAKKLETMPKLVEDVNRICRAHIGQRGIVHTHTFEIADALLMRCDDDVRKRFIFQKAVKYNNNKHQMLAEHKESEDTVIIAPAMHEGLDLKDDLGRFQIICKVPYPSKGDPQIAARMELSSSYYDWRTAVKLVQEYGRVIRHSEDFADTYVLDADFRTFVSRCHKMLPEWFIEAIHWSNK